jgi:hypothetical protein
VGLTLTSDQAKKLAAALNEAAKSGASKSRVTAFRQRLTDGYQITVGDPKGIKLMEDDGDIVNDI